MSTFDLAVALETLACLGILGTSAIMSDFCKKAKREAVTRYVFVAFISDSHTVLPLTQSTSPDSWLVG